jgi:TolB-like protein/class 3 adenylate cyclase/Tfp pilus assembly protein PilF
MVDDTNATQRVPPGVRWKLRLLGEFSLTAADGVEATGLTKLHRALLTYLVLSRRTRHPRPKLAALFWPNRIDAPHSLSQSLNVLRKALNDSDGSMIVPKSDPLICRFDGLDVDASEFECLVSNGSPDALERAAALYGADLLDGTDFKSEEFGRWLAAERERLRGVAVDCFCRLAHVRAEAGFLQPALEAARRALSLDELCEEAHRAVLRLHLQVGQHAAARQHAQACEDLFRRKGVALHAATQTLLLEARSGAAEPAGIAIGPRSADTPTGPSGKEAGTAGSAPGRRAERGPLTRKLTAILAADVAGYTRLMAEDEAGTFDRLRTHRKELFEPEIAKHGGCIFKLMGDGLLAEFASVVDAVECAVVLQRRMAERNADVAEDQRIAVRMAINLGDVIVDGEDRYGDGINIAARLQQLAKPGSVYVSRSVYEHVRKKLALAFDHLGDFPLKNVAEPLAVYRVRLDDGPPAKAWLRIRRWQWPAAAGLAVAAGVAVWLQMRDTPVQPTLPDRPSIVVLPFNSFSGDSVWARLADGLTEDVTTSLSRSRDLFVIARNSAEIYKGKPVDVQEVGEALGVKYVLEGSVQASSDRVRVTAQLIDAANRSHIWSETYDRPATDIFSIQDDVTANIAGRLLGYQGALNEAEREKLRRKPPTNLKAFDYYLLAMQVKSDVTQENIDAARALLGKAIALDPELARAYVGLAWLCELEISLGLTPSVVQSRECKLTSAKRAVAIDQYDAQAHLALATYYADSGDFQYAAVEFQRAEALAPNDADVLLFYGTYLVQLGEPERAVEKVDRAVRLNPHYPSWYNRGLRAAYYFSGRFGDALAAAQRIESSTANDNAWKAIALAQLGRSRAAREAADKVLATDPEWSAERRVSDFGEFARDTERMLFVEGARKASLPICATAAQLGRRSDMRRLAVCEKERTRGDR